MNLRYGESASGGGIDTFDDSSVKLFLIGFETASETTCVVSSLGVERSVDLVDVSSDVSTDGALEGVDGI